ncbi:MAG: class I SAM-dependent RNA methyltransferase [Betaproteobacteria bacterium]|nr:class I SAM-dependent RNA methyltransferase [Betaproteobacteria bacterium]
MNPDAAHATSYFATCPRGLETLLADELNALGASTPRTVAGGVSFKGDVTVLYRANLESRLASRILVQLSHGAYRNEQEIYDAARAVAWHKLFRVSQSIRVDLTATRSPLKSLDFATLRIKDAVCDRFRDETGQRPDVNTRSPDIRIAAFVDATHITLYLDSSGEPLYKRGYRTEAGEAPLKENLAAGIIRLSGWQAGEPLFDPMCGSGTVLAEAAMIALDIAPGSLRRFGFENFADHDAMLWGRLKGDAAARRAKPRRLAIFGSDVSARELGWARENLAAIGIAGCVDLKQANALEVAPPVIEGPTHALNEPAPVPDGATHASGGATHASGGATHASGGPTHASGGPTHASDGPTHASDGPTHASGGGVLITNPPYGVRLGDKDDMSLFYPKFGDALKQRFAGWRCYILSADPQLKRGIRLHASRRTPIFNGPLECRLYEYRIIAGSMRRDRGEPA